jgi:CcmD family protein
MMAAMRRLLLALTSLVLGAGLAFAQQPPPSGQTGFVPLSEAAPVEQLPAAPLLIAAYAFVWVAALFYLWTIRRRLGKVEADMQTLERRSTQRGGAR